MLGAVLGGETSERGLVEPVDDTAYLTAVDPAAVSELEANPVAPPCHKMLPNLRAAQVHFGDAHHGDKQASGKTGSEPRTGGIEGIGEDEPHEDNTVEL